MRKTSLSIAEARRIALGAQQFGKPRLLRGAHDLGAAARKLGAIQIDSVNVLVRSHYLPSFSRFGAYRREWLDTAAYDGHRRVLFEFWGHEASFLPVEFYPLFQWRMEHARRGEGTWGRLRRYATEHQDLVASALNQIRDRGPLGASELEASGKSSGGWWGWSQGKEIMEWLFWTGQVTTASRRNFERLYDLTERALPPAVLALRTPSKEEAQRTLMEAAARAIGVGTLRDLRDYFRLPTADAAHRLRELLEAGVLIPIEVEGWKQTAYMPADTRLPKSVSASALLSPFDSLIWERQRTERLFDFSYRLEIYTPAHKRQHGYYVLPFLLGDQIVARVDLKSDRHESRLQVRGGSVESKVKVKAVGEQLGAQLQSLAAWLDLERVQIASRRGELMKELRRVLT
ncbi:MAG: winged helix-turn-helix domain-containing protein [Povalibacter sp.]